MSARVRGPKILRNIPIQQAAMNIGSRFLVLPCGRRSGKTELGKYKIFTEAMRSFQRLKPHDDEMYFVSAPTHSQAKRIYWNDLKKYFDKDLIAKTFEADLILRLKSGCEVHVLGMEKPERAEGTPWDGCLLDEYANMKEQVWKEHVRPALSDRGGWAWFVGVPEGRNHYYDLHTRAQSHFREAKREVSEILQIDQSMLSVKQINALSNARIIERLMDGSLSVDHITDNPDPLVAWLEGNPQPVMLEWAEYQWGSELVLPAHEIEAARRDMSKQEFDQEYNASFVSWSGRVYDSFERELNVKPCRDDMKSLHIGVDFNMNPMCASASNLRGNDLYTFHEFTIKNANTEKLAKEIWKRFQKPARDRGTDREVIVYPDPAGSARHTSSKDGVTDHTILRGGGEYPWNFTVRAPRAAPSIRDRVNVVNARFCNARDERRAFIDPDCENLIKCIDGQPYKDGTTNPSKEKGLDHHPDAYGYKVVGLFPPKKQGFSTERLDSVY